MNKHDSPTTPRRYALLDRRAVLKSGLALAGAEIEL